MSENDAEETGGLTVIAIPADKTQAVIDFVASLTTEETDVTGYMLSTGMGISAGSLANRVRTSAGCYFTGLAPVDFTCSSSD
jgi:hypothetical protein